MRRHKEMIGLGLDHSGHLGCNVTVYMKFAGTVQLQIGSRSVEPILTVTSNPMERFSRGHVSRSCVISRFSSH